MQRVFHCYSDPGHGWVKVPERVIKALGLTAASFTSFSFVGRGCMYLEEDCDAAIFVRTYRTVTGEDPQWRGHHCNSQSRIRSKHHNCPEAARFFIPSIAGEAVE